MGNHELCTALFADDILIFTSNPQTDMLHIQLIFSCFWVCSGLKINFSKSEILPLYHARPPPWMTTSVFPIARSHITYLGIKIDKLLCSLYHLNYSLVMSKVIGELETWVKLPLTFFGRCHLFKMVCFPKLLYPLQTISLLL